MKATAKWFQQGDVRIHPVAAVPSNAKEKGRILAEGEVTGHAHRCDERAQVLEADGILFLHAPSGTIITHEEHGPVTLEPGDYQIGAVKEYDYDAEEIRSVAD